MFGSLVLLNALAFFTNVTVYMALMRVIGNVSGNIGQSELNLCYMLTMSLGILAFGKLFRQFPEQRHSMPLRMLALNAAAIAALAASRFTGAGFPFLLGILIIYCLSSGYFFGYLVFLICRHVPLSRQGACIGLFLACANLIMFVADSATRYWGDGPFLFWSILFLSLAVMAALLARPLLPETKNTESALRPLVRKHLPLLLTVAVLSSLLTGFGDSMSFYRFEEYLQWHSLTRLINVPGFLLAGWLADSYPIYLPLAAILAKAISIGSGVLILEGASLGLMFCIETLFTTFMIVFLIWMFVTAANHLRHPEFWAGMGRAIELPCCAVGALLGTLMLQKFPTSVILLFYMALLLLTAALFYQGLVQYNRKEFMPVPPLAMAAAAMPVNTETVAGAEPDAPAPVPAVPAASPAFPDIDLNTMPVPPVTAEEAEAAATDLSAETGLSEEPVVLAVAEASAETALTTDTMQPQPDDTLLRKYQQHYQLTNRETEVLAEILQKHKIADIAANLFITQATVKYHISNLLQKTGARNQRDLRYILGKLE